MGLKKEEAKVKNINHVNEIKNIINGLFHLQTQIHLVVTTLNSTFDSEEILSKVDFDSTPHKISYQNSISGILSNYSIILFNSFFDEYNRKLTANHLGNNFNERIDRLKSKNKPGVKRISKWKDLSKFRNNVVAHSLRVNNKSLFSYGAKELQFKIPNTNSEKNLFSGIIYFMCLNIRNEFIDIALNIDPQGAPLDKFDIVSEFVDSESELADLYEKMC